MTLINHDNIVTHNVLHGAKTQHNNYSVSNDLWNSNQNYQITLTQVTQWLTY